MPSCKAEAISSRPLWIFSPIFLTGAPVATGQQQLKHAYEGLFKAFQLNVEYFIDEVIVNGDFAYARTHSKGSTVIRATGATVPVDNKEIFGLHKGIGGWKISHYIFNNNTIK